MFGAQTDGRWLAVVVNDGGKTTLPPPHEGDLRIRQGGFMSVNRRTVNRDGRSVGTTQYITTVCWVSAALECRYSL